MKTYYIYMITNKYDNDLYTGVTNILVRRIFEHKNKLTKDFLVNKENPKWRDLSDDILWELKSVRRSLDSLRLTRDDSLVC